MSAPRTARDFCGNGNGNGGGGLRRVTIPGVPDIETPFDDLTTPPVVWDLSAEPRAEADPPAGGGVEAIRRAIFDEAQDTRATDGPAREAVPGAGDLLHRGVAALFFGERGGGKSMVALMVAMGAAAAGERVLYLDRENGAALTRDRIADALDAHPEWMDPLAGERLTGRHYPDLNPGWDPKSYAEAIAGLGYTVVIYDSWREFLSMLRLDPDRETDISKFLALAVTPLVRRALAVALLDNVGHEATHRPKGSGSKLDALPQAYKVTTTSRFTEAEQGRVAIVCTRSRYGDLDREWTMRLGGGVYDVPEARTEAPDARRAREAGEARERFREACVAVLSERRPVGRDALIAEARKRGAKGKTATVREWLTDLAADPASGLVGTESGYDLTPGPAERGHSGATPPPGAPRPPGPLPTGAGGPDPPGPWPPGRAGATPTDRTLDDALDDLAESFDGVWINQGPPALVERWCWREVDGHLRQVHADPGPDLELAGRGNAARLRLTDDAAEAMLDAMPDRLLGAKQAAAMLGVSTSKLTAMWKAGEVIPAVGTLPAVYAAIPEPACTRPDTYYLRSAIERYAEGNR